VEDLIFRSSEVEPTNADERRLCSKSHILSKKRRFRQQHIVYFLISGNEIVYVGKSDNGISRIYSHLRKGDIIFDSYWFELTTAKNLTRLEKRYIKQFDPEYNKQHSSVEVKETATINGKQITFKHKRKPRKPWNKGHVRSFMKKQAKAFLYQ